MTNRYEDELYEGGSRFLDLGPGVVLDQDALQDALHRAIDEARARGVDVGRLRPGVSMRVSDCDEPGHLEVYGWDRESGEVVVLSHVDEREITA